MSTIAGTSVSRIPTDVVFDRPALALGNLLRGDVGGLGRSILSPKTLSPGQAQTPADQLGLIDKDQPGFLTAALRAFTNPLVLIGALLALKYPIPAVRNLFRYSKELTGLNRSAGAVQRWMGGIDATFLGLKDAYQGKEVVGALHAIGAGMHSYPRRYMDRLARHILQLKKQGVKFDAETQVLVGKMLDDPAKKVLRWGDIPPPLVKFVERNRSVLNRVYEEVPGALNRQLQEVNQRLKAGGLGEAETQVLKARRKELQNAGQMMSGSGIQVEAPGGKPGYREGYWPHRRTDVDLQEREVRHLLELAESGQPLTPEMMAERAREATTRVTSGYLKARRGRMVADPQHLRLIERWLQDPKKTIGLAEELTARGVPAYSLMYMDTMSAYLHSMAKVKVWAVDGHGLTVKGGIKALRDSGVANNVARAQELESAVVPLAMNRATFTQSASELRQAATITGWVKGLESDWAKKYVPEDTRKWLVESFTRHPRKWSRRALSTEAAGWMYSSTLGAPNVGPTSWNLLQNVIFGGNFIGFRWLAEGIGSVARKTPKYMQARVKGVSHGRALKHAWPEFVKENLQANPMFDEVIGDAMSAAWEEAGAVSGIRKVGDRVKRALMSVFQTSETFSRLSMFEGTRLKAMSEALRDGTTETMKDFVKYAVDMTRVTQFLGGPMNAPKFAREWSPLFRQFAQFPARSLSLTLGPAVEMGSGMQAGAFGRNWGTLGRILLSSGLAYELGREVLGKDISHGLVFGALPSPQEGQPFYPLPFVPPALSLAGGAMMDVWEGGEQRRTARNLPLLVPGGLGLARAAGAVSPEAAKFVGRNYVDWDRKLPDGRVPMFTRDGSFRAYLTPFQVWGMALGAWGETPPAVKERELLQYLLGQRDRIRTYRRDYIDALAVQNDPGEADKIQTEFQEVYPGLGPLQFTKKDLRAVHLRKMVPRLERILEQLPSEYRGQFGAMVSAALLGRGDELLGVDPLLFTTKDRISARDPWRERPTGNVVEELYQRQINSRLVLEARRERQSRTGASLTPTVGGYPERRRLFRPETGSRGVFSAFSGWSQ